MFLLKCTLLKFVSINDSFLCDVTVTDRDLKTINIDNWSSIVFGLYALLCWESTPTLHWPLICYMTFMMAASELEIIKAFDVNIMNNIFSSLISQFG